MSLRVIAKRPTIEEVVEAGTPLAPCRDGGGVRVLSILRPERGFTLLEALVVLLIMGLIAALAAVQINNIWQKSRLRSEAGNLSALLQSAYNYMVTNRAPVFVRLVPGIAGGPATVVAVTQNVDGSGTIFGTYTLPSFATLDPKLGGVGGVNGLSTSTVWPCGGGSSCPTTCTISSTTPGVLEVDTMGRAVDPCTGTQVKAVQQLLMTHVNMVGSGASLTPEIVYTMQVFPVWKVRKTP